MRSSALCAVASMLSAIGGFITRIWTCVALLLILPVAIVVPATPARAQTSQVCLGRGLATLRFKFDRTTLLRNGSR